MQEMYRPFPIAVDIANKQAPSSVELQVQIEGKDGSVNAVCKNCALFCLPICLDIQRSSSGILADAIREDEPLGSWKTLGK